MTSWTEPKAMAAARPAAAPADIEFRAVTKRFGAVVAVDDISFEIARGSFHSFLGPSGCGKTTSLRLIAGFEQPDQGEVAIGGRSMVGVPAYRRPVNMVFQHYALFPHMNVADNVGYGLRQARPRLDRAEIDKRVAETLELVRLPKMGARRTWELSGGQQQRVALARALVNRPTVLLLDEPLAALDRKLRRDMQIELQNLQRDVGITFILVTHDQEEALSMSDTIAIMRDGRIVQFGTPQQLYDAPLNRYVADFVGESNFLAGKVAATEADGARLELAGGIVVKARWSAAGGHLSVGQDGVIAVRPEVIGLWPVGRAPADLDLRRQGQVRNRIFLGDHTEFSVLVAELGELMVRLPKSDPLAMRLQPGDMTEIGWRGTQALALPAT
ncbi:MAG TPA: ABC transporter ATP-binding protein [Dongiaceae bacterium]|nr:ABC transporter ATP-binding protein [Dongiaceae bacterium]